MENSTPSGLNGATTTDSMEDLARAFGINAPAAEPAPPAKAPEPPAAAAAPAPPAEDPAPAPAPAAAAPAEPAAPITEPPATPETRRSRAQERISQLTLANSQKDLEMERLRQELEQERRARQALSGRPAEPAPAPTAPAAEPARSAKPKQDDFASFDEFNEALVEWRATEIATKIVDDRISAEREAERKAAEQRQAAAERESFDRRIAAAAATYPDFHEVMEAGRGLPVTPAMRDAIMESPLAGDVMYFLNRRADICTDISRMRPIDAIKEIGRIEAAIHRGSQQRPQADPPSAKPAAAAPVASPRPSSAPPPAPTVRTSSTTTAGVPRDPNKIGTLAEWEAFRNSGARPQ